MLLLACRLWYCLMMSNKARIENKWIAARQHAERQANALRALARDAFRSDRHSATPHSSARAMSSSSASRVSLLDASCGCRGARLVAATGSFSNMQPRFFMHYAFDAWMTRTHPDLPWCRYADDGVVHCRTERDALARRAGCSAGGLRAADAPGQDADRLLQGRQPDRALSQDPI